MGVMMAKAMGNTVTVLSTSSSKETLAKRLGADNFVISRDQEEMKKLEGSLDLILDTVGADHDLPLDSLKTKGTIVVLGIVSKPFQVSQIRIHVPGRKNTCQIGPS